MLGGGETGWCGMGKDARWMQLKATLGPSSTSQQRGSFSRRGVQAPSAAKRVNQEHESHHLSQMSVLGGGGLPYAGSISLLFGLGDETASSRHLNFRQSPAS